MDEIQRTPEIKRYRLQNWISIKHKTSAYVSSSRPQALPRPDLDFMQRWVKLLLDVRSKWSLELLRVNRSPVPNDHLQKDLAR